MSKYSPDVIFFAFFYLIILYFGLNSVIMPIILYGFLRYIEFYFISILILLPALILLLYLFDNKLPAIKKRQGPMKIAIYISVAAASATVFIFTVPV